jgi:hypothetical protein
MPAEHTLKALADGLWNTYSIGVKKGVSCYESPDWDPSQGVPAGNTVLSIDIPEHVFRAHEVQKATRSMTREEIDCLKDEGIAPENLEFVRMGNAHIPAEVLQPYGKPRLYDHDYSHYSRVDLVRELRRCEAEGDPKSQDLRNVIELLDNVGWKTPVASRGRGD